VEYRMRKGYCVFLLLKHDVRIRERERKGRKLVRRTKLRRVAEGGKGGVAPDDLQGY